MTNLYGLLNVLRAPTIPHVQDSFSVYAQLSQGLGEMSLHYDIRRSWDDRLIHTSLRRTLNFRDRSQVIQVVTNFERIRFEVTGVYFVELYCENTWVGDVTLLLSGG